MNESFRKGGRCDGAVTGTPAHGKGEGTLPVSPWSWASVVVAVGPQKYTLVFVVVCSVVFHVKQ